MKMSGVRIYSYLTGFLLLTTAASKLFAATGSARILEIDDPIIGVPFHLVFLIVGAVELAIAIFCFFSKSTELKAGLVAWLATCFLVYRLGLAWMGYHRPCSCLGNLTDRLHVDPETADAVMKVILGYLLIYSYGALLWVWQQRRKMMQMAGRMAPV
jgi:hypothetical protein